jgi:hypothetical protein
MSNQAILEKAISLAIENGWLSERKFKSFKRYDIDFDMYGEECSWCEIKQVYSMGEIHPQTDFAWYADEQLIFNKDFAKALWGEEEHKYDYHSDDYRPSTNWQYHLQQMVVAANPIDYLGAHLDD